MRCSKMIVVLLVLVIVVGGIGACGRKGGSYTSDSTAEDTAGNGSESMTLAETNCDMPYTEEEKVEYEEMNTEEYNQIEENRFLSVANQPLSTFSADVDTASYSNIRRMLQEGTPVDPGAVRIEEMLNYFKYDYRGPEGEEPFGVNVEISECPWNQDTKLMLVGLKTKEIDFSESPSSNLVFLLDVSGSMSDANKLPLMQKAFSMLTENLTDKDRVSIVTYAGSEAVILEGARGDEQRLIKEKIDSLEAGGSTAGSEGIKTAYEIARRNYIEGGNNRVILATDGDLNVGVTSESELSRLITKERKSGVFLSVLGFGTGNIKDNKMETLADDGNGNYAYIDSIFEAKKVLVDELGSTLITVAKDVKFQVEFNPDYVKGYRLIGYENRLLNPEDFRDDTKDAGEVGAGHCVTALYEIVPVDSPFKISESDLKYQSTETKKFTDEWLTINIRYKEPESDSSQLLTYPITKSFYSTDPSEDLRLAACVAEFGMLLKQSEYLGTGNLGQLLDELGAMSFTDEYKQEFVELVKMYGKND